MSSVCRTTVKLTFPSGSGTGTNTWHWILEGSSSEEQANMNAAMNALQAYYTAMAADVWNSGFTAKWDGEGSIVDPSPHAIATGTPWSVAGSGTANSGPAGVGLVVGWRTGTSSRHGKGRTFHAPYPNSLFDGDGTPSAGVINSHLTRANTLIAAGSVGAGFRLAVWSPSTSTAFAVTSARITDRVAFLSSRRS